MFTAQLDSTASAITPSYVHLYSNQHRRHRTITATPSRHRPTCAAISLRAPPSAYHHRRRRSTTTATALPPLPSPYHHGHHRCPPHLLLLFPACWTTAQPVVPNPATCMVLYRNSVQSTTATSKTIRRFDTSGSCVSPSLIQLSASPPPPCHHDHLPLTTAIIAI